MKFVRPELDKIQNMDFEIGNAFVNFKHDGSLGLFLGAFVSPYYSVIKIDCNVLGDNCSIQIGDALVYTKSKQICFVVDVRYVREYDNRDLSCYVQYKTEAHFASMKVDVDNSGMPIEFVKSAVTKIPPSWGLLISKISDSIS